MVNLLGFLGGFFGKNGKYKVINSFNEYLFSLGGGAFGFLLSLFILKKFPSFKSLILMIVTNFAIYASLLAINVK
ncbi:MAG: hypothetical protein PWQ48_397 [Thermotogaceae bacterium]|jgi:hypothetical protein|nr:hypothetical protein [Thermotogaceae bacterium]